MKKLILPLVTAALLLTLAGCVSYGDYRKEQEAKDTARLLAGIFAVGAVITLVVGAALGSRFRDAK